MAQNPGRASQLLKARARRWLAQPGSREAAARYSRSDWRALRPMLAGADADAVLRALAVAAAARTQLRDTLPVPWTTDSAVAALTSADVHVQLFGALRLLQAAAPGKERLGYATSPDREAVRLDQALLMGFTDQEVVSVRRAGDKQNTGRVVLTQHAVGLLGPNGPMPYVWTQHVRELPNSRDSRARDSFLSFINVVQRRQLSLLYRAWSDSQAITAFDGAVGAQAPHPIADRLGALACIAHADMGRRDSIPGNFKRAFAGVLSRRVCSPVALAAMLSRYLDAAVRIEEFSSRWLDIPEDQRTRLGVSYSHLGGVGTTDGPDGKNRQHVPPAWEAVAGVRAWDCTTRFDIVVGPLPLARYEAFLPGRPAYREIRDLVAVCVGAEWEWRLRPVLHCPETPRGTLGNEGARLGWTTWLGLRPAGQDAADLALDVAPDFAPRDTSASPHADPVTKGTCAEKSFA